MMRFISFVPLLLPLLVAAPAATAQGGGQYGWLRGSPIIKFTDKDWELLRSNARTALDDEPDGTTTSWGNPDTGHSGSITVISSFEKDGRRCRKARFSNEAGNLSGTETHDLCKVADGTWKIAP